MDKPAVPYRPEFSLDLYRRTKVRQRESEGGREGARFMLFSEPDSNQGYIRLAENALYDDHYAIAHRFLKEIRGRIQETVCRGGGFYALEEAAPEPAISFFGDSTAYGKYKVTPLLTALLRDNMPLMSQRSIRIESLPIQDWLRTEDPSGRLNL